MPSDFRERVRFAVLWLLEAIDQAGHFLVGQFSPIQCLAEDVAAYLGKISGAEVRVVDQPVAGLLPIFVGCAPEEVKLTKATEFGDTSVVDVTAQRIVLHGESRRVPWTKDCPRYFALGIKDVSIESAKVFTASTWGMHRILTPKVMAELAERGYVTLAPRPFLTVAPLRDSNFPVKGLTDAQHALTPLYKLLAAEDRLTFDFPDTEHTFPRSSRDKAYTWLDRWLKPNEARPSATGK